MPGHEQYMQHRIKERVIQRVGAEPSTEVTQRLHRCNIHNNLTYQLILYVSQK